MQPFDWIETKRANRKSKLYWLTTKLLTEIILSAHTVKRNNIAMPMCSSPLFPSGNNLYKSSTIHNQIDNDVAHQEISG